MQLAQAHPADAQYLDIPSEERLEDGTTCGYCQRGRWSTLASHGQSSAKIGSKDGR